MGVFIIVSDGFGSACADPDCPEHGARNRAQAGYVATPIGNRLMQIGELEVVADVEGELATADTVRPPALLPAPKPADLTVPAPPAAELKAGQTVHGKLLPIEGFVELVHSGANGATRYGVRWSNGTMGSYLRDELLLDGVEWFDAAERTEKFRAVYKEIAPIVVRIAELGDLVALLFDGGGAAQELQGLITETLARHGLGRESYKKLLREVMAGPFGDAENIDLVELAAGTWP